MRHYGVVHTRMGIYIHMAPGISITATLLHWMLAYPQANSSTAID